jgi:hypothetical protein
MKRSLSLHISFYVVFSLFFASSLYAQDTASNSGIVVGIKEAITRHLLKVSITGSANPYKNYPYDDRAGIHYGKCIEASVESTTDSFVYIQVDCGTLLEADDTMFQKMIVTNTSMLPLLPHRKFRTQLYAMCTQFHKAAPYALAKYRIGEMASEQLWRLARYIDSTYSQNMPGQHAIWAYTDSVNFEQLQRYGADTNSIKITKNILYGANVITSLNPPLIAKEEAQGVPDPDTISMNRYLVYGASATIGILLTSTISLARRKRRRQNNVV